MADRVQPDAVSLGNVARNDGHGKFNEKFISAFWTRDRKPNRGLTHSFPLMAPPCIQGYLKCDDDKVVRVTPYLPSSFTMAGAITKRLAR